MIDLERRDMPSLSAHPLELRESPTGGPGLLVGYGAVFNRYSADLGGFVEQVDPNAFARILATAPTVALHNHDMNRQLGARHSGTLTMSADSVGLRYEIDLPDTGPGQDVRALVKRGDLRGSSFAFRLAKRPDGTRAEAWGVTEQGYPLRTLLEFDTLRDLGPVTDPAYPTTADLGLALRSLVDSSGQSLAEVLDAGARHELRSLIPQISTEDTDTSEKPTGPVFDVDQYRRKLALRDREARQRAAFQALNTRKG